MDDLAAIPRSLDSIRSKLAQLRERDARHSIFGAETHGYVLAPCLGEEQIRAVEADCRVRFPESYRRFRLQVGNGSAGPGYGLLALEASLRDRARGRLARPFPKLFVAPHPGSNRKRLGQQRGG